MTRLLESLIAQRRNCRGQEDWCKHRCKRCQRGQAYQARH